MQVCVTGWDLPVGRAIRARLETQGVQVCGIETAMFLQEAALTKALQQLPRADYVIHAVELDVEASQEHPEQAKQLNTMSCFPVMRQAKIWRSPIILLSSFLIFDGDKKNPYISANTGTPLNAYGATKVEAENILLEQYPETLVLRLGWMLDSESSSWSGRMINRIFARETIRAYENLEISPTAAEDVARVIDAIIKQLECEIDVWGVYHYAGVEPVSHAELVKAIQYQACGQGASASQIETADIDELAEQLPLPHNGVLGCIKLRNTFGIKQLPWRRFLPAILETQQKNLAANANSLQQLQPG